MFIDNNIIFIGLCLSGYIIGLLMGVHNLWQILHPSGKQIDKNKL